MIKINLINANHKYKKWVIKRNIIIKAIHVISIKASVEDHWPIFPQLSTTNIKAFKEALPSMGIIEYGKKNINECISAHDLDQHLVIDQYFVFPNDSAFEEHKDFAYAHLPLFKFDSESESRQYCEDNHITITFEEVDNPDLTGYTIPRYVFGQWQDDDSTY